MTSPILRPRRSVLYMPGANARAMEKAKTLDVDALILDLEDSVSPDSKADARDRVCAAARSGDYGYRELVIRTNGIDTEWHGDDLAAAAKAGPDGILVPKVNSADEVRQIEAAMVAAGAPESTRIWAMIETPTAIRQVHEIAAASDRLAVLVMGTNDLVAEIHASHVPGRAPLMTALSQALMGAAEAGKAILDGVYNDVKNAEGFDAECEQGREFGFDGKTIIHPSQIDPTNRIFAPSPEAIEYAREVIAAFEAATAAGKGVVTVNGRMIENLHVRDAERILAFSQAISAR
ncbi:MAG: CoA ester lyase [Kineosporiaceae bacterium]|nr:CoA ester lyase [Aeromicrobium sp.]